MQAQVTAKTEVFNVDENGERTGATPCSDGDNALAQGIFDKIRAVMDI